MPKHVEMAGRTGRAAQVPRHASQRGASWTGRCALLAIALALLVALGGCGPSCRPTVETPDGTAFPVNREVLAGLADLAEEIDGKQGIPMERVLWQAGHRAVERLIVVDSGGVRHELDWPAMAASAWWLENGRLVVDGETLAACQIQVQPPARLGQVEASITDIAPTAAQALRLPVPAQATGQVLREAPARHVLLLFLDGFGYERYSEALRDGLIPNIAGLGEPLTGLTVYPPSTSVASAAVLSGAPPEVNGVDRRGIRKTEVETLFDVAAAAGRKVVAVEGEALPFNLRNAEVGLSGDRDGNGSTDDNVLTNALAVLQGTEVKQGEVEGMPDLLYVHFHGIDDAGHTYGPGTPEESAAIRAVDAAVGQLLGALPPTGDTLIIAFADHGMHPVEEEGRLGNHGTLSGSDMFIPIWVTEGTEK